MLIAGLRGPGTNIGLPDPCATPPVGAPIPYPNIGLHVQAAPFALKTKVRGLNALNMMSKITMTSGMEAGVMHPLLKQMGGFTMGYPKVIMEGAPVVCLTSPTTGNMMNNGVGLSAAPDPSNVFYGFASGLSLPRAGEGVAATVADEQALARRLACTHLLAARAARGGWYLRPGPLGSGLAAQLRRLPLDGGRLVLDLRGNPGGTLAGLAELLGCFLPRGAELFSLVGACGRQRLWRSERAPLADRPLLVLVDRWTASTAEVLTAALRAHDRAVVVGEPTHGKTSVQAFVRTPSGALSYVQVGTCWLRGGALSDGAALQPDVGPGSAGEPVGSCAQPGERRGRQLERHPALGAGLAVAQGQQHDRQQQLRRVAGHGHAVEPHVYVLQHGAELADGAEQQLHPDARQRPAIAGAEHAGGLGVTVAQLREVGGHRGHADVALRGGAKEHARRSYGRYERRGRDAVLATEAGDLRVDAVVHLGGQVRLQQRPQVLAHRGRQVAERVEIAPQLGRYGEAAERLQAGGGAAGYPGHLPRILVARRLSRKVRQR